MGRSRVATADVNKAITNVLNKTTAGGWGPNALFRFPKNGGTGGIWKNVAEKCVPRGKQRYNSRVAKIDALKRQVTLECGSTIAYGKLLSTMPLDATLRMVGDSLGGADKERCDAWASKLKHSSSHIVGVGIRGANPHDLKCWLYYPEDDCPFYRCTVFSHYAEGNCPPPDKLLPTIRRADESLAKEEDAEPRPGPYWSLMLEVS